MKRILHLGIFLSFIYGCKSTFADYSNAQLETGRYKICFYMPSTYLLKRVDTLRYDEAVNAGYKYQRLDDTSITLSVQHPIIYYPIRRTDKCDVECRLKETMLDLSGSIDTESQYGYLTRIGGKTFGRVHANLYQMNYVTDEIFTLKDSDFVILRIASWNYNLSDSVRYTMLRDSFFNSVRID